MRYWPGLLCLIFSFSAFADRTIKTQIHDFDMGKNQSPTLVFLRSGDVVKMPLNAQKADLKELQAAKIKEAWINITIDANRFIKSIQSAQAPLPSFQIHPYLDTYEPSILNSMSQANTIFEDLNGGYRKKSQCYNRAHVWSYESLKKYNLNSMKVFLFFTRKYIREFDFGWWFHVSPFTYVSENEGPKEMVLDYRFLNNPVSMKRWTNIFMQNDATCPAIQKYSDYAQHEYENYCYIFKASMFYYQPLDLDKLERTGQTKHGWVSWEVNNAYDQGFSGWW